MDERLLENLTPNLRGIVEMRRFISVVMLAAVIGIGSQTAFAGPTEIPGITSTPPASTNGTTEIPGAQLCGPTEIPGVTDIITIIAEIIPL